MGLATPNFDDWAKVGTSDEQNVVRVSTFLITKGINIRMSEHGNVRDAHKCEVILGLIDSFLDDDNPYENPLAFGKHWGVDLSEVIRVKKENRRELLAKLEMAHQDFLNSSLANELKCKSKPSLSREELSILLAQMEQPLSVVVREGRRL